MRPDAFSPHFPDLAATKTLRRYPLIAFHDFLYYDGEKTEEAWKIP